MQKNVFINLSCILLSPIIAQWDIMKIVIKTEVTHDLIRCSKQVFHKTVKAPTPDTKMIGSTTVQEHLFLYVQLKLRNKFQQILVLIFLTKDNYYAFCILRKIQQTLFFSKKGSTETAGRNNTEERIILVYFQALKKKSVICKSDGTFRFSCFSCFLAPFWERNHRKSFYCYGKYFVKENFGAPPWTLARCYCRNKMGNPKQAVSLHLVRLW